MAERPAGDDASADYSPPRTAVQRRRLLALAGVGAAGLAGCGSRVGDSPETTDETLPPPETTTERTTHPAIPPEDTVRLTAPSSAIAPTDGFATDGWLGDRRYDVDIAKVTNLDSSGPGSLVDALTRAGSQPRIVVFEVGGVVNIRTKTIFPDADEIFVAGQTAPSPGITLRGGQIEFGTADVAVQHVRFRKVGGSVGLPPGLTAPGRNVIFDHCSASWSQRFGMFASGRDITLSNNLVAETLADADHYAGEHSRGALVDAGTENVAMLGNVLTCNRKWNPRLEGGSGTVFANNVVADFQGGAMIGGGTEAGAVVSGEKEEATEAADGVFVGNHWLRGADTPVLQRADVDTAAPAVYAEDNALTEVAGDLFGPDLTPVDGRPLWPEGFEALSSDGLLEDRLATVGARPAERTHHDERIVENVRNGGGEIIDDESEVGGQPELEATQRTLEPPENRADLADWLRQHTRAVELGEAPP